MALQCQCRTGWKFTGRSDRGRDLCAGRRSPEGCRTEGAGEKGNWDGWVAGLAEFREGAKEEPKPADGAVASKGESGGDPFNTPTGEAEKPKKPEKGFLLDQGSLTTALWKWSKSTPKVQDGSEVTRVFRPGVVKVTMKATIKDGVEGESGGFEIKARESEGKSFKVKNFVSKPIIDALTAKHGSLPKNGEIVLSIGAKSPYTISRNGGNLTGPGFILADAAITGIKPDALVVAALDEKGKLGLATDFWRMLTAMKSVKGRKIVLPVEAEEYLIGILTLENVEFFLKNEVLLASSNDEFIALERAETER